MHTIIAEMGKGNFSFFILIVGIIQLIVMVTRHHDAAGDHEKVNTAADREAQK